MMCIAASIIIWSSYTRINEHYQYHADTSIVTTQKTSDDVSFYIREKKRLIHLFAKRNSAKLWKSLQMPEDDELYQDLLDELTAYFPSAYAFTVTDNKGHFDRINFENIMGDKCINDLHQFIQTGEQSIRIHPAEIYHFDLITDFTHDNKSGVFFVSFNTDVISNSLLRAEIPGHLLLLSLPTENQLIEITSDGARNIWKRNDYRLNENETRRILSQAKVVGTEWSVVDLHDKALFKEYKQSILVLSYLIIFILAVASVLFMTLNHHEIRRRQKAENAKDEFLSIVSHELRTPLTAINGAITLINNGVTGELNEKTKSILTIADNNTHRLTLLVNDLLDVQRLESKQMKYMRQLVKPIVFVNSAITDIQSGYFPESCNINLNNTLNNELVFVDLARMEQVIENILSNAIKYGSKKGDIDINISRSNEFVIIAITDYGQGINEVKKNNIFEKFTQTKMTDNRHATGSGLGLYIVKMIIEYHAGKISYHSISGKGTTFYIQLPIVSIKNKTKTNYPR